MDKSEEVGTLVACSGNRSELRTYLREQWVKGLER